jgi:hypothetical protein
MLPLTSMMLLVLRHGLSAMLGLVKHALTTIFCAGRSSIVFKGEVFNAAVTFNLSFASALNRGWLHAPVTLSWSQT